MAVQFNAQHWFDLIQSYQADAADQLNVRNAASQQILNQNPLYRSYRWDLQLFWNWGGTQHHYHHQASSSASEPKQEAKTAVWIGLIMGTLGAITTGYFYSRSSDYAKPWNLSFTHLEDVKKFKPALSGVEKVIAIQHKINETLYTEALHDFYAMSAVLGGSIAAVLGGLTMAPMLITVGYTSIIAGVFFFLWNKGLHWNDASCVRQLRLD